jgi:hypothetical protein
MMLRGFAWLILVWAIGLLTFPVGLVNAAAPGPLVLLEQLDAYPHARQIEFSKQEVLDHEIGLGAIQKVRGEWRFKHSERLSGTLVSYTWQIVDGFTSAQVMEDFLDSVAKLEGASPLFACQGRACGQGVQWANRVFHEQVLYGREDLQRYRVYALQGAESYRLVAYSAARTEDRQYLHVDLLRLAK